MAEKLSKDLAEQLADIRDDITRLKDRCEQRWGREPQPALTQGNLDAVLRKLIVLHCDALRTSTPVAVAHQESLGCAISLLERYLGAASWKR